MVQTANVYKKLRKVGLLVIGYIGVKEGFFLLLNMYFSLQKTRWLRNI